MSAATAAAFVVSFVMAWSPVQRSNAGIIWVEQPGDYANQFQPLPRRDPNSNVGSLSTGLSTTNSNVGTLSSGVGSLSTGLSTANSNVSSLSTGLASLSASISSGTGNATGSYATALGKESIANGTGATAIGGKANATGSSSTALGYQSARPPRRHGARRECEGQQPQRRRARLGLDDGLDAHRARDANASRLRGRREANPANGVVSVGAPGAERQIQNVAAGQVDKNSTDAINGSQLYNSIANGPIVYTDAAGNKTPLTQSHDVALNSPDGGPVTLHNVRAGSLAAGSTEAVNGGQINGLGSNSLRCSAAARSSIPQTGTITGATYNIQGKSY